MRADSDMISTAVFLLADWAMRVAAGGVKEPWEKRKPYTRVKPIRRGHKRGPYKKHETVKKEVA